MMKLRLAEPETLIDINGLDELAVVSVESDQVRIGAMVRHAALLSSPVIAEHFPIFTDAERLIADPIVRNRGTVGGSLCQADPSEDLSAAFSAMRATAVIRGADGERGSRCGSSTAAPTRPRWAHEELLVAVRVPILAGLRAAPTRSSSAGRATGRSPRRARCSPSTATPSPRSGSGSPPSAPRTSSRRGRGPPARRPGERRGVRRGRADRRAALLAQRGPARPGGLQAPSRRRAHHQGAAPGSAPEPRGRGLTCRSP